MSNWPTLESLAQVRAPNSRVLLACLQVLPGLALKASQWFAVAGSRATSFGRELAPNL